MLEDIDHIEVIRGPGAALWGANAVNCVINIITRKARDTRGTMLVGAVGTDQYGLAAVRHGMATEDGDVRVWAKGFSLGHSVDLEGNAGNDYWRAGRVGFRGDWNLESGRRLTLSGEAFEGPTGDRLNLPDVASPTGITATDKRRYGRGADLLAQHEWLWADGSEAALQSYVETHDLEISGTFMEKRATVDFDFQHRPHLGGINDVIWGLGYRESRDDITSGDFLTLLPPRRNWRLISAFIQDEITLQPDELRLVLAARLEHNNFTSFEPQPNIRMIWTPTPNQTVWGAISRAVQVPSRAERDA